MSTIVCPVIIYQRGIRDINSNRIGLATAAAAAAVAMLRGMAEE